MADEKITELPIATSVNPSDILPIVQSGTTKQATANLIGGSFLSANTARVDPSGNDVTGTIGDLNKPFLTVQASIDAMLSAPLSYGVIYVNNPGPGLGEDLTIDNAIDIDFIGTGRHDVIFNSLTLTVAATIGVSDSKIGDISTSADLTLNLDNTEASAIESTQTGGSLNIISLGNNSETTTINCGELATLTVIGVRPAGVGADFISCDGDGSAIIIRNCSQQSGYTGCYYIIATLCSVEVTNSLLFYMECLSATMIDSRMTSPGSATIGSIIYQDIFLKAVPPGGTTGQALEKVSNDDFDTGWITP